MALRLLAFGVRIDVPPLSEKLVHQPPFPGGHRVQRHRPTEAQRLARGLFGLALERVLPATAIALGVYHHAALLTHERGDRPLRKVLHRVDRLPVAPDEEPEIVAVQGPVELSVALGYLDGRLEIQRLGELSKQVLKQLSLGH